MEFDFGKILLVGAGKMGLAILSGALRSNLADPLDIIVAEPSEERREIIEDEFGVTCVGDASIASTPDTCILAVKPQVMDGVLKSLSGAWECCPKRIISVAAGVKTSKYEKYFPKSSIIRVMPNIALTVGEGMVAVSPAETTDASEAELVQDFFSHMGNAVVVDESLMDAVTAISGSGPAYFAMFADYLAMAGIELGLSPEVSQELSINTMLGTAELLKKTNQSPNELILAVSSPGGTTVAALQAMQEAEVGQGIIDGAKAAEIRSKELS